MLQDMLLYLGGHAQSKPARTVQHSLALVGLMACLDPVRKLKRERRMYEGAKSEMVRAPFVTVLGESL